MALSENFRRLIVEGVIDFAPDTFRVSLITAPPDPTAVHAEVISGDGAVIAIAADPGPTDGSGYVVGALPGETRIEPTEWVSETTDAERQAWRTAAYGDDDAYEETYGITATNPFLSGYRGGRFKPPKRSRWSHAGPFVYPRA